MNNHRSRRKLSLVPLIIVVTALFAILGNVIGDAEAASVIDLEIGKAKLIRLRGEPDVVILGNPAVADVVIEDGKQLFLLVS